MNKNFSLSNLSRLNVPFAVWLLVSGSFILGPLISCSADTDKPQIVRTSVPDDGYKPPQKAKKNEKQKPKIISFRKHEPADA
jgi:hypothetical protein